MFRHIRDVSSYCTLPSTLAPLYLLSCSNSAIVNFMSSQGIAFLPSKPAPLYMQSLRCTTTQLYSRGRCYLWRHCFMFYLERPQGCLPHVANLQKETLHYLLVKPSERLDRCAAILQKKTLSRMASLITTQLSSLKVTVKTTQLHSRGRCDLCSILWRHSLPRKYPLLRLQ